MFPTRLQLSFFPSYSYIYFDLLLLPLLLRLWIQALMLQCKMQKRTLLDRRKWLRIARQTSEMIAWQDVGSIAYCLGPAQAGICILADLPPELSHGGLGRDDHTTSGTNGYGSVAGCVSLVGSEQVLSAVMASWQISLIANAAWNKVDLSGSA